MSTKVKPSQCELFAAVHYSSTTDEWATHENTKLPLYWTKDQDGLTADWRGKRIWMNPPYGRTIGKWVAKAANGGADICVCLLPARTDTRWYHDHIHSNPCAEVRFLKGRLRFGDAKHAAPFPSMLVIFRSE